MRVFASAILAVALLGSVTASAVDVVEFHIKAGTGSGPWNKFNDPIQVKVGQTLRFINDDSISHYLHTNGSPCPHGTRRFAPGESYDCVISKTHRAADEDLYDHDQGPDAQVYVQAN
jgi:plastocyanin